MPQSGVLVFLSLFLLDSIGEICIFKLWHECSAAIQSDTRHFTGGQRQGNSFFSWFPATRCFSQSLASEAPSRGADVEREAVPETSSWSNDTTKTKKQSSVSPDFDASYFWFCRCNVFTVFWSLHIMQHTFFRHSFSSVFRSARQTKHFWESALEKNPEKQTINQKYEFLETSHAKWTFFPEAENRGLKFLKKKKMYFFFEFYSF